MIDFLITIFFNFLMQISSFAWNGPAEFGDTFSWPGKSFCCIPIFKKLEHKNFMCVGYLLTRYCSAYKEKNEIWSVPFHWCQSRPNCNIVPKLQTNRSAFFGGPETKQSLKRFRMWLPRLPPGELYVLRENWRLGNMRGACLSFVRISMFDNDARFCQIICRGFGIW